MLSDSESDLLNLTFRNINFGLNMATTNPPTLPTTTTSTTTASSQNVFLPSFSFQQPLKEEVNAIYTDLKLPSFWSHSPEGWFYHVEAMFTLRNIGEKSKYLNLVSALPDEITARVMDHFMDPTSEKTYNSLKKLLLARLTLSEEERINRVLYNMEIGDRKPSEFYRRMVEAAGTSGDLSSSLIYKLWLKRLPKLIECTLIPLANRTIEEKISVADSLYEASKTISLNEVAHSFQNMPSVSAVSSVPIVPQTIPFPAQISEIADIKAEINELKEMMKGFAINNSDRARSRNRDQSICSCNCHNTRSFRPRSRSKNSICFYHSKYGKNAHRCIKPCSFVDNSNAPTFSKNN